MFQQSLPSFAGVPGNPPPCSQHTVHTLPIMIKKGVPVMVRLLFFQKINGSKTGPSPDYISVLPAGIKGSDMKFQSGYGSVTACY